MGDDRDIIVLSFSAKNEGSKRFENFLEKGYPFVLDADALTVNKQTVCIKCLLKSKR